MTHTQFEETKRDLLDRFGRWAAGSVETESASHALDFKWSIQDPYLTHWVGEDIDEMLFGYLPARVFLVEDEVDQVLDVITRFLEFLEAEGSMAKGSDRAADLAAHLESHREDFRQSMEDPETGGHAKRLLMAMRADGVDFEDNEAVNRWMEEFNAGPIELREAVLGPAPDPDELEYEPAIPLPPRPPVDEDLARSSASDAPMLRKLLGLAEYMGEGRPLTGTGNLKLADARELVDRLETGDRTNYDLGGKQHSFRSAQELIWLDMIVWLGREMGAVKVRSNKMSATKAWLRRLEEDPLAEGEKMAVEVVTQGPLTALWGEYASASPTGIVIDASAVSVLAGLYDGPQPVDALMEALTDAVPQMIDLPDWYFKDRGDGPYVDWSVRTDVKKLLRVLDWAGVLVWTGFRRERDRWDIAEEWRGGEIQITALGAWLLQGPLSGEGLVSAPVVMPLTATLDDPPEEIVAALARAMEAGPLALAEAWKELGGYQGLPEQLWRVDRPEAASLLEALGQALPDKATAKAARKALLKHRSWLAGRS